MILVTGATGNVGREVASALLRAGEQVRALTRSTGSALPDGAHAVVGDLDRPESLRDPLEGVRGVFLLPGYADMPGVVRELRNAGVAHVVLLSGGAAAARNTDNAISQYMLGSEEAVRRSGLEWTILRPCEFMSNALRWLPQLRAGDVVRLPFGDLPTAVIDLFDIAAVAAVALLSEGHHGRTYRLSGGQSLYPGERVRMLGAALGRDLQFEEQSDEEARVDMSSKMPAAYVDAFFGFYRNGELDESKILPILGEITKTAPRTFPEWAAAHADAFR